MDYVLLNIKTKKYLIITKMTTIGVLLVATGKYISFFKQFYDSSEKYFLKDHKKVYFLFTDNTIVDLPDNVVRIYQEAEPWPKPTLHRYHYFLKSEELINLYNPEYLFYSDVDMRFCDVVDTEILPEKFLGVLHPGFYNTNNPRGTPETNEKSKAYISPDTDFKYICGGFNGAKTGLFLEAFKTMKNAIDTDAINGIIPVWHDESVWNKFMSLNQNLFKFVTPSLCYPESWTMAPHLQDLVPRLLALDKNHTEMRS